MTPDRFFDVVGAFATIVAFCAVGASAGIILRLARSGALRAMKPVALMAASWCLLASTFIMRFWTGAYRTGDYFDRVALSVVLVAFTAGGLGLWWLWKGPSARDVS